MKRTIQVKNQQLWNPTNQMKNSHQNLATIEMKKFN
jgi:hypothetical protein